MRYELFIGLRYLRARRRETFISLITVISVLGVMIWVSKNRTSGLEDDLAAAKIGSAAA